MVFNAFIYNSSKEQGTYVLYMNSTCSTHTKNVPLLGCTAQYCELTVINHLLLDISQLLNILTDSTVYLNLNDNSLGCLKKNESLPVIMGSFGSPVCTFLPPNWYPEGRLRLNIN